MRWIIILIILISPKVTADSKYNDYYDFLQPLVVNFDKNQSQYNINNKGSLALFQSLALYAPHSKQFYNLNYQLMQNFQYKHFYMAIKDNNKKINQEKIIFQDEKNNFIKILKSIKNPSFFTLYSKLYLETLDSKRLKHKDIMRLYKLANKRQQPYAHLLSYLNSLNQLSSISIVDQENLHKKLTLLLIGLPKKQQKYILRLTALQLLPLYDKNSIEFKFNKLFAQKSTIKRDDILHALNFEDADLLKEYLMKKKRSFFENRVFTANMKALHRNDIAMILAILYMQKNNFDEARSCIRQTPRSNLYSKYNPFSTSISIDNRKKFKKSSSLREFAETMSRLEKIVEKKSPSARDFYLYGNGLYNKSWFGNFPKSSVFFHNKDIYIDKIPPTTNLEKARNAYEDALRISTKDEFKAEIAYQLLKIEFNMAMINHNNYTKSMKKIPKLTEKKKIIHLLNSSRSFIEAVNDYKLDYTHTKYGKRVIENSILFTFL